MDEWMKERRCFEKSIVLKRVSGSSSYSISFYTPFLKFIFPESVVVDQFLEAKCFFFFFFSHKLYFPSLSWTLETWPDCQTCLLISRAQCIRESVQWTYWSLRPCGVPLVSSQHTRTHTHTHTHRHTRTHSESCLFCYTKPDSSVRSQMSGRASTQNKQGCLLWMRTK